jgi:FkbM family methyltransferase
MLKRLAKTVLDRLDVHVRKGAGGNFLKDARQILGNSAGLVLFDVGGNIGQTIEEMLQRFNAPLVYCFEPSPKSFAALQRFKGTRVTLENCALGDSAGSLPFHTDDAWTVNDSLLQPTFATSGKTVQVTVDTLDSYCSRAGVQHIDLLKIDAQGYDLKVLAGASALLARKAIRLFTAEINLTKMYHDQPQPSELFAFAESRGYRLVSIYPGDYWNNQLAYVNAMFERQPPSPSSN